MRLGVQPLERERGDDPGPVADGGGVEVGAVVVEGVPDAGEGRGDDVEDGHAAAHERQVVVLDAGPAELARPLLRLRQERPPRRRLEQAQPPHPPLDTRHRPVRPVRRLEVRRPARLRRPQQVQQHQQADLPQRAAVRRQGRVRRVVPLLGQRPAWF